MEMPDLRKPLLYVGGVLGILFLVALGYSLYPKILFSFQKAPSLDQAKAVLLQELPHSLPPYLHLNSVDQVNLWNSTSTVANFEFQATLQTTQPLYSTDTLKPEDKVAAFGAEIKNRLQALQQRNQALPAGYQINTNGLLDNLPAQLLVATKSNQTGTIKGGIIANKGSDRWTWSPIAIETSLSSVFPGTPQDNESGEADENAAQQEMTRRLDSFEQLLVGAETRYTQFKTAQAQKDQESKALSDKAQQLKTAALAMLTPGASYTGAAVYQQVRSWQVNLKITDNQYSGQIIQGVFCDPNHPEIQRTFNGVLEEVQNNQGETSYRLNITLNHDGINDNGQEPDFFSPNKFGSLTIRCDLSDATLIKAKDDYGYYTFSLQKDLPGSSPAESPAPTASSPKTNSVSEQPTPASTKSTPAVEQPAPSPASAPSPPETSPPPAPPDNPPPPVAPPVSHATTNELEMYSEGNFPQGTLYAIPQLESLVGQSLSHAWLYGAMMLKSKSGKVWTFHSYRIASGIGFDVIGGEGNTTIVVEFPDERFPQIQVGQIVKVGQATPFELISVTKSDSGHLIVHARNRLKY